MPGNESLNKRNGHISEADIEKIQKYVESIQYGSITLVIQEGKIVQIEKNEKIKLK